MYRTQTNSAATEIIPTFRIEIWQWAGWWGAGTSELALVQWTATVRAPIWQQGALTRVDFPPSLLQTLWGQVFLPRKQGGGKEVYLLLPCCQIRALLTAVKETVKERRTINMRFQFWFYCFGIDCVNELRQEKHAWIKPKKKYCFATGKSWPIFIHFRVLSRWPFWKGASFLKIWSGSSKHPRQIMDTKNK